MVLGGHWKSFGEDFCQILVPHNVILEQLLEHLRKQLLLLAPIVAHRHHHQLQYLKRLPSQMACCLDLLQIVAQGAAILGQGLQRVQGQGGVAEGINGRVETVDEGFGGLQVLLE